MKKNQNVNKVFIKHDTFILGEVREVRTTGKRMREELFALLRGRKLPACRYSLELQSVAGTLVSML